MSVEGVVLTVAFGLIAVTYGIYCYWRNHPAVRLRREIKERLEREKQAKQQLDDAYQRVNAELDQAAREWDQSS